jgi:hypothetical protein
MVVGIGVGQPSGNTVQLNDYGAGGYSAEWNGGPFHPFKGVQAVEILTERARHNQVTIELIDRVAVPLATELGPTGRAGAGPAGSVDHFSVRRTSGTAVQTGSVLSIMVNKQNSNAVEILDQGAAGVAVEWNGGTVHSFTGVMTIIVQTQRAKNDHITFFTSTI